ncbi:MAG: hypothetical protein KGR24_09720 [Planctomycetes bacterium]|nr:hypothetical protein [Planctomycetota bacterium]
MSVTGFLPPAKSVRPYIPALSLWPGIPLRGPAPDQGCPIHLEFDIPRLGRRVDAVLVLPECVIPIEFKVGAKKFERLDYEQAWDFRIDLKNFHAPSPDLGVP